MIRCGTHAPKAVCRLMRAMRVTSMHWTCFLITMRLVPVRMITRAGCLTSAAGAKWVCTKTRRIRRLSLRVRSPVPDDIWSQVTTISLHAFGIPSKESWSKDCRDSLHMKNECRVLALTNQEKPSAQVLGTTRSRY